MIKGVVFDMDGLMFDTEKIGKDAWQQAARHLACGFSDQLFHKILGTNLVTTIEILEGELGDKIDVRRLREIHDVYFAGCIEEKGVPVKNGLKELLEYLRTNGYGVTAASSTSKDKVRDYFKKAGVSEYFGEIVGGDMVEKSKPEPDIYLKAAEVLGLSPFECLALEDSPHGILSAYRAGLMPIMIPDLVEPDEETSRLLYAKLPSLLDVIVLLKNIK